MDSSFIPIEVVPSKTPFGLDQLRRSYKTSLSASEAIAACPAVGAADDQFPFMFLMPINTPESAESATRVDLVYMGCFASPLDDGNLPAPKSIFGTSVQSANSQCAIVGLSPNQPFTLQYYSKTTTYVFFSYLDAGTVGTAPDPIGDPIPITLGFNDCSFIGGGTLAEFVENFFVINTTDVITSEEIVPGKYWLNTEVKTKYYAQPIFGV